jgi:hypothetical protein
MSDESREEYEFDYTKARRNRFVRPLRPGSRVVYLEPEVATVFEDSESVNRVLKALLQTMPSAQENGDH